MGILNFLDDLQKKGIELQNKSAELMKKRADLQKQLESDPAAEISKLTAKKTKPVNKTKRKSTPKPDRSIEGISKQILAQRDSLVRNGFKQYEFMANSGCCEKCAALNGKHFRISNLKIGVNAPPMHEGCRCSIASWVDDAKYEAWLNSVSNGGKQNKRR